MGELTPKLENIVGNCTYGEYGAAFKLKCVRPQDPSRLPSIRSLDFVCFVFSVFISGIVKEGLVYDILLSTPIIFTSHLINII